MVDPGKAWNSERVNISYASSMPDWGKFDLYAQPAAYEYYADYIYYYYGIIPPMARYMEDKGCYHYVAQFPNNTYTDGYWIGYSNYTDSAEPTIADNDVYSFDDSDDVDFGNNAPICFFLRTGAFEYNYVGQYGETRSIDLVNSPIEVKIDGELLGDNTSYIMLEDEVFGNPNWKAGVFDIAIDNQNFEVDGIKGRNYTELHYNTSLTGKENKCPPVLRMMQIRNQDGKITNKADKPSDLTLGFSANKYVSQSTDLGYQTYYDTYKPENVKFEYAAHGTEDFVELPVTEYPDKYFFPSYGNYYTVALEHVDQPSADKWYDVRFTLSDSNGNYQVQTIGPAFRIDDVSGISEIAAKDSMAKEEYYNLQGIRVTNPAQGELLIHKKGTKTEKIIF